MVDVSWVLALMIDAQPTAPWRATYESTAAAIARAANANPLPFAADREERTAALLVSTAWFESAFKQNAEGDFVPVRLADGTMGKRPTSFCLVQIAESNFRSLHVTRDEVQTNIDRCVTAGLVMMHVSWSVCRGEPLERRLAHYAGGGYSCPVSNEDAKRKSGHRVAKALWLYRHRPPSAGAVLVQRRQDEQP